MKLVMASIGNRGEKRNLSALYASYVDRSGQYISAAATQYATEHAFFKVLEAERRRTAPVLVLLDSRGKMLSSEEFAGWIGRQQELGTQMMVLAVGPADGWSEAARSRADLLLSFGRITLPHGLARVVLAEQIYRAFTILAGHPYHGGH